MAGPWAEAGCQMPSAADVRLRSGI